MSQPSSVAPVALVERRNDCYDTTKVFGLQDDAEFYFNPAKDFIEDPDAKPLKVEKYFLD